MTERLALFTFGIFNAPADNPANAGFHTLNDLILAAIEKAEGFIARSGYEDEPGPLPWGEQVFPKFYKERGDGWSPATLSLWRDLETAMAFSYHGIHQKALVHGREWMVKPAWPPYALWWVSATHVPIWQEAVARHLHLHEQGASATAFTFKQAFCPAGQPVHVDMTRVHAIAGQNHG